MCIEFFYTIELSKFYDSFERVQNCFIRSVFLNLQRQVLQTQTLFEKESVVPSKFLIKF